MVMPNKAKTLRNVIMGGGIENTHSTVHSGGDANANRHVRKFLSGILDDVSVFLALFISNVKSKVIYGFTPGRSKLLRFEDVMPLLD